MRRTPLQWIRDRWPAGPAPAPSPAPASSLPAPAYRASDVTYQMLDEAFTSGGPSWLADAFATRLGGGQILLPYRYPILLRCVSLIAGLIAQLMTSGSMTVQDLRTGRRVPWTSASRAGRALDLLTGSPDGIEPAYTWIETLLSDLLTASNAIARVERDGSGLPRRLIRQSVSDVQAREQPTGRPRRLYRTRDWSDPVGVYRLLDEWDVVHAYWGTLQPAASGFGSAWLATPVLTVMRSTLEVGAAGERYVREYFESGASTAPYVIGLAAAITDETNQEITGRLAARRHRTPLVIGGDPKVTALRDEPQSPSTQGLREFQIDEIARVYGLPHPLVGRSVSSWGSVVAELGRFAWRFGVRQHADRFLAALSTRLLSPGQAFRLDPIDMIRGDPAALAGYLQAALGGPNGPGWMSREEVRRWAGLPRDIDGDLVPYLPSTTDLP